VSGRCAVVHYENERVGQLREDDEKRLVFAYAPEWLGSGFPISLTLPLSQGERWTPAYDFFVGLLPEGRARSRVCQRYRLPEHDDLGLLLAIGRDCAGALSILPEGAEPISESAQPLELADETLHLIVESHGQVLASVGGEPQRFSSPAHRTSSRL